MENEAEKKERFRKCIEYLEAALRALDDVQGKEDAGGSWDSLQRVLAEYQAFAAHMPSLTKEDMARDDVTRMNQLTALLAKKQMAQMGMPAPSLKVMEVYIYHNPACSKSRRTLELLEEYGDFLNIKVIRYLEEPPDRYLLEDFARMMRRKPRDLIRFKESAAGDLGIAPSDERPDAEWCEIMEKNPVLIERPIVFCNERAVLGRPPENIWKIIDRSLLK